MAVVGRNKAVVDLPKFRSGGFIAWLIWMFVHLMSLVGFRNKIAALFSWAYSYFTYEKALRLIIRPYKRGEY
jgi:NADH dehydrogenase